MFRVGRSPTFIAKVQRISRQYVYQLVEKHERLGVLAFKALKAGRPRQRISKSFANQVVKIRLETDYGSQKLHFVLKREGFSVSQRQIQNVLNDNKLTEPCEKRRGQRKYVRYVWPVSNYMWHVDWSQYKEKWYCAFIDDCSRKIMAAGEFSNATEENTVFLLYQAMLNNEVCPVIILSDKGAQFYANKWTKRGVKGVSQFEEKLEEIGIDLWTARVKHPQTNGKMEKWFDTLKQRKKRHPNETLQNFINWYNQHRIHHALNYETPDEVYQKKL